MAAVAAPVTTADVVALQDRLTRFVFASFHRKLTFEEAGDAAAEALGEADRAVAAGQRISDLNAWLCTAAWRNAIGIVRRIEGEGKRKRLRPVDVSEQGEWLLDERDVEDEILTYHGRRTEHEALLAAWSRLKADEQRALYLRYFDELPVDEVLSILGCSRHHYENLTKRGLRKLRDALVADARDDGCRRCRTAIVDSRVAALADGEAALRDAHLSSCLPCRAFQRRQRGLIAVLPLPSAGFVDRLTARLHALTSSGGAGSGEVAAGTVALAGAGTSAGAGMVGAGGGLVTLGGATKAVAVLCSAGAVTAGVCVGGAPFSKPKPREPRAVAPTARADASRSSARPVAPATTQESPPTHSTATASARSATPAPSRTRAAARAQIETAARKASSPFLPESAASPPPRAAAASSSATSRPTTFSSRSTPPVPARSTSSTASARAAFSEEFTP